jgi:subtilisin-like proprotein convertase family protein
MDQVVEPQALPKGEIIANASVYLSTLPARRAYLSHSDTGERLDASVLGVDIVIGGPGNDTLIAAPFGSWLMGGGGSNWYIGDEGNDVFVISAHDEPHIHGGGGSNTIILGDEGVKLGDNYENIQLIHGGKGNDTISVKDKNRFIDGKGGTNTVVIEGPQADYHIEQKGSRLFLTDSDHRIDTVMLSHIQKIQFTDVLYVKDELLPSFTPVDDDLWEDQTGQVFTRLHPHLISSSQLLSNDEGGLSHPLYITTVNNAIGGSVSLTESGHILFIPDPNFTGLMQFEYEINDVEGRPASRPLSEKIENIDIFVQSGTVSLLTPELPHDPFFTQQWPLSAAHVLPVWEDYTGKGVRIGQFEPFTEKNNSQNLSKEDLPLSLIGIAPCFDVDKKFSERVYKFAAEPINSPLEVYSADLQHCDLAPAIDPIWHASLIIDEEIPIRLYEHATNVAGVMVAARNDQGMVGVAYDAKFASYVGKGNDGGWLAPMLNSDIVNHSWGVNEPFLLNHFAHSFEGPLGFSHAQYVASNGRGGRGTIIVVGAGNDYEEGGQAQHSLFNNNRFSIEVGATHAPNGPLLEQFSSPGASVLLSAPGFPILTASNTKNRVSDVPAIADGFTIALGTSVATPMVSGIVALMLEANPNLGYRDVQKILALTARRVDNTYTPTTWDENAARNWNGGGMHTSYTYGFGSVDARAAVRLAETWLEENTADNEAVITLRYPAKDRMITDTSRLNLSTDSTLNIEHVEVDIDLRFAQLKDASVTLISPSGIQSVLLGGDSSRLLDSLHYTFMSTRHWAEPASGEWTLEVASLNASAPVNLHHWALRLYGKAPSLDDTYFYTDEYKTLSEASSQRAILDDAINGTAGGRNTLHAGAVTGNTRINLHTGEASLGGSLLTIAHPETIHNLISGDGDDVLIANDAGAILAAGRGHNTLRGGRGADLFVIQRRQRGSDTVENFESLQGDKIVLVGFKGKNLADFAVIQQGQDIHIALGKQSLLIKDQVLAETSIEEILALQDSFTAPEAYVDSESTVRTLQKNHSVIHLTGGETGVKWTWDTETPGDENGKPAISLGGTLYRHDRATSNHFIVMPQPDKLDYTNTVQGFKPGIDKIDLRHLRIKDFSSLQIEKTSRDNVVGSQIINGVNILSKERDNPAKILYMDGMMPLQVSESDFIFAENHDSLASSPDLAAWEHHINGLATNLISTLAVATEAEGVCPIEEKYYTNETGWFYGYTEEYGGFTE